jgi:hypothetical protein
MNFQTSPKQALALWNLLFTGDEPSISNLKPALTAGERRQLEEAGLIELEKRGRARHIMLTDEAWAWAADHLDGEISVSKYAAPALRGVLTALKTHLRQQGLTLAEFVAPEEPADDQVPDPGLSRRVREAYLKASAGQSNVRVRLCDLRRELPDVSRDRLDRHLVDMQAQACGLVLWPLDDPLDLTTEDQEAALEIAGEKRHILYLET